MRSASAAGGVYRFHPMFETGQFSSIFPMVAAGVGITLIPAMAAGSASGCRLSSLEQETFRRVGYVRVRRHVAGAAQSAFVKWLRQESHLVAAKLKTEKSGG